MKNRRLVKLVILVISFGFLLDSGIKAQDKTFVDLLPMPKSIVFNKSFLKIKTGTMILVSGDNARFVGKRLSVLIHSIHGINVPVRFLKKDEDYQLILSQVQTNTKPSSKEIK